MLTTLPCLMQQRIADYLQPEGLLNLVHTCRNVRSLWHSSEFWEQLLWTQLKYEAPKGTSADDLRQYYFTLSKPIKKSCSRYLIGAHTSNHEYWSLDQPCYESEYGMVAHLWGVSWLELAIKFENVPPGRYALVWRVALVDRLRMFHTIIPVRARDAVLKRGGDGYLQCCLKEPKWGETVETPVVEHTHVAPSYEGTDHNSFDSDDDGENRPETADYEYAERHHRTSRWSYILSPSTLIIKELSDVVSGSCMIDGAYRSNLSFDYCQLLLLDTEDPIVRYSKAVQKVVANNRILNFF